MMETPKIYVGPSLLLDFERAIHLEWITTNGLGGYASSTVLGINTRKYHGLLVAAFNPPTDRRVLLTKLDEEICVSDESYLLGSNEFKGVIDPRGYKHMCSFSIEPFPSFQYEAGGLYMKKTLFMPYLKNMVVSWYDAYNILNEPVEIRVFLLVNSRHFYDVTNRYGQKLSFLQEPLEEGVHIGAFPRASHLIIWCPQGHYSSKEKDRHWIEKIYFRIDDTRREACLDDNYQLGFFTIDIDPKERKSFQVAAVAGKDEEEAKTLHSLVRKEEAIKSLYNEESSRKNNLLRRFMRQNQGMKVEDWLKILVLSTDLFIVRRKSTGKKSIIAGYHWFEDWGRDSLISLPGLTLVTGRFEEARDVLLTFSHYCKSGVMPNRFPDRTGDQPVYNAVDASLWFFHAVFQYLRYSGDFDFVYKELWRTMGSIVQNYEQGTLFNIHMDDDGLIEHGPQLTWMDATVDGKPVTPREGKAVEIQALWYNALKIIQVLAKRNGQKREAEEYGLLAEKAYESFNRKFWNSQKDSLFDVIYDCQGESSLRPNQVFTVSLDFPILDETRREKVVDILWSELWSTYGLKTLSDEDPQYKGRYEGGFAERDAAYHNGTVWPWLTGPFVTAFLKVKKHQDHWRKFVFENFLQPLFLEEPLRAGLGLISEIFDGDSPHLPRGCIAQAWSMAEPLRAYIEDVLLRRPPFEESLRQETES